MTYRTDEYVKLLLGVTPSGRDVWLKCLKPTAEFYGWSDFFAVWRSKGYQSGPYWMTYWPTKRQKGAHRAGYRLRISRSPVKRGYPAGLTNCFRVSSNTSLRYLRLLAAATTAEWEWMEDFQHRRVSRDLWLRP